MSYEMQMEYKELTRWDETLPTDWALYDYDENEWFPLDDWRKNFRTIHYNFWSMNYKSRVLDSNSVKM